ncbi:winged helix-turn-helix domain-containing protein [Rahnella aquatilis]|uniref:winged helix-turn-helix domain-containing protein n=1 Tax=Rahnella aquatilis TaxID=34038 RepID=UPI000646A766|nr:winged helix-turn-helix domain-containing protein [Rahnella aquatilis]
MDATKKHLNIDSHGEYILNIESSTIYYKTQKHIQLQDKELKLLTYLLENKTKTLSKDEIIYYVWPKGSGQDYGLSQLIHKIRKILNQCNREIKIKTIRGFGYCLVPNDDVLTSNGIGRISSFPLKEHVNERNRAHLIIKIIMVILIITLAAMIIAIRRY